MNENEQERPSPEPPDFDADAFVADQIDYIYRRIGEKREQKLCGLERSEVTALIMDIMCQELRDA